MSTELNVIPSSALTEQEQADLNASIDSIIAAHKNDRQEINRLVFESVSAMTDSEGYEQELSSRKGLRRFWGAITGSNKRLQDKINSSRAAAQFAAQTTLQRFSEQNLLTFDLITAVNNKLNASMTAVEGEINQIYAALIQFFKQNRSDMIQLENRVANLEQNVNLLNWQNSIEYQMLDGVEYVDLDDASKIVCMVRDFYDITGGEWRTSDLLLLKTVMSTIDISPRGNIRYYDFIVRVAGDEKLLTKLLGGKHIQRLPETYLVPLLGIKKLELLDTDEAYIVDTVENSLQSAGVVADRHKLENNLVQNYVAQESQVNLDTEVNNYDLTMEMLFNLRFAEDSGLFLEEVVPEVQEVETEASGEQLAKEAKEKEAQAKAEEEKKKLEEDYKEAAELFKNAKFKQVYPLLKDLSNRGCARANALLYWLCYDEFNDKMAVTYAKKGYEAGDAIASIQYAFDCEIDPKKKKEIFEKYKPILWDQSMEGDIFATYKQPFYARATLCYFPKCMRDQGVDYTSTEMDIHFGRVVETKGKASISPINSNSQGDEGGKHLYEPEARQLYRKWDNVKLISEELKDRAVPRKVYGAGMWGLSIKTKERLKEKNGRGLSFGVVVTLKEMYGENRIDDFIKLCTMRGWVVNRIDVENQIDIYNKAEEEIEF